MALGFNTQTVCWRDIAQITWSWSWSLSHVYLWQDYSGWLTWVNLLDRQPASCLALVKTGIVEGGEGDCVIYTYTERRSSFWVWSAELTGSRDNAKWMLIFAFPARSLAQMASLVTGFWFGCLGVSCDSSSVPPPSKVFKPVQSSDTRTLSATHWTRCQGWLCLMVQQIMSEFLKFIKRCTKPMAVQRIYGELGSQVMVHLNCKANHWYWVLGSAWCSRARISPCGQQ